VNGDKLVIEAWMARKLGMPMSWAGGVTTREERRERIRAEIIEQDREYAIAGKRTGQSPETWGQLFQRVYGQPVNQQPPKERTCAE
jgi:hypothetical protein